MLLIRYRQQQWVCLKILTADGTCHSREPQTLHALQSDDATNHVVRLLDQFVHAGPNGSHLCLVFELLGPSVDYVVRNDYEPDEHLEPDTILRITVQLLEGLAYVHEAGYAQGGKSHSGALVPTPVADQKHIQIPAHAMSHSLALVLRTAPKKSLSRSSGPQTRKH